MNAAPYILIGITLLMLLILMLTAAAGAGLRKKLGPLCAQTEKLRRLASQPISYREALPQESADLEAQPRCAEIERDLNQAGLSVLGDRVESAGDGKGYGASRWFVSADGIVCGWFSVIKHPAHGTPVPFVAFFSESADGHFLMTGRGGTGVTLASPPVIHRLSCGAEEPLAQVLAKHRARAAMMTAGSGGGLQPYHDIEEAVGFVTRSRAKIAQWRATRPEEALLEEDIRLNLTGQICVAGAAPLGRTAAKAG